MRGLPRDWNEFGRTPEPKAAIESGDLQGALSGFATREMLDYRLHGRYHSDVWICGFGVAQWLMGDTAGAARVWSRACDEALAGKFRYSSTGVYQAGFLLWFASVWLKDEDWHDEASALFDKLLRRKRLVMGATFPSLIARLLRKEVELPEVLAAATDEARERMTLFYGGVRAFEEGDRAMTRRLWAQAKAPTYSQCEFEHYLLEHEKKKLEI